MSTALKQFDENLSIFTAADIAECGRQSISSYLLDYSAHARFTQAEKLHCSEQ